MYRCTNVPGAVHRCLMEAAGAFGYKPRRNEPGWVRKGSDQNWGNWAWQDRENGAVKWWTGIDRPDGYGEVKFYQALVLE